MVIRNLDRRKPSVKRLVFITILLAAVVFALIKIFNLPWQEEDLLENIPDLPDYTEWEHVVSSWKLYLSNHFPYYTHVLDVSETEKFGLKSSHINLNDYSWSIEVEWSITTIVKSLPVIDLKILKLFDDNLIVKNNSYFFVDDLLYFDFADQNGFGVTKTWNTIEILFQDLLLITIERSVCNQVTDAKNCNHIAGVLKDKGVDRFTSYLNHDFYKYGTGGAWITFNKDIYSYIFTPINQETMLDISSITSILDSKYVMVKKQAIIAEKCQKDWEKFDTTKIAEIHMSHANLQEINLILKWKTVENNTATCMLTFDLWQERATKNVIFDIENK